MRNILIITILAITSLSVKAQTVKWPFGAADFKTVTVDNDTLTMVVTNSLTYITGSTAMAANTVLLADISSDVKAGAMLFVRLLSDGTARSVTPSSTYFTGVAVAGVISKTKLIQFIYDGSKFVYVSSFQID